MPATKAEDRTWTFWCLAVAVPMAVVLGVPLAMPLVQLLLEPTGWDAWSDRERIAELADNTLRLVAGTLALAVPAGTAGAVLLYRTDLPLRRCLRFLTVLMLFIPLPLFVSAWQAALGPDGLMPLGAWSAVPAGDPDRSPSGLSWKPWSTGIGAAIWLHALAGLPWVIVIVGQGLGWVETELEEDALTAAGPWRVLWQVTLPRCRAAILAAGLWVALQAATDITVTDTVQVRTFAEEVYWQIGIGGPAAIPRSVAVAVPSILLTWVLVVWAVVRLRRKVLPLWTMSRPPLVYRIGRARWLFLAFMLVAVGVLAGVPVTGLVWKAGLAGKPPSWSPQTVWQWVVTVVRSRRGLPVESLLMAAGSGVLAAALALPVCWLAARSRWFEVFTLTVMTAALALPGPVVGFGLMETIARLLDLIHSDRHHPDLVAKVLWYGPSPLPNLWAYLLRLFPFALAILWPVVRLIPVELHDAARVDGARPGQDLRHVVLPLALPACVQACLAVTILALGEISASKLAETPGSETFAHFIFVQMHYGVANDVAAGCLLLLAVVVTGGLLVAGSGWLRKKPLPAWSRDSTTR
ncbi:MAG TPA: ABC transporter permease subunit [Gemmataceae bacterium]|nr:ABC transporter permease subunit [Gemmataceae bacterium]